MSSPGAGLRACVLAAALVATACGSGAAGREDVWPGDLVEEPCGSPPAAGARCGRLSVRESRAAGSGRSISLRVIVLPATRGDRAADPIFFLAGGPGQAASEFARAESLADPSLRLRRDLVFLDQRGTGGSRPLQCRFYGPPDDPQSYFDLFLPVDKVRACRQQFEREADLAQYTTAASVEDLDEVREALGYARINLIGGSYGSRLAMEYVRRFEPRVRTVVLEGPVPPSVPIPQDFGVLAQRSLDGLLTECLQAQCADSFPDIRSEARAVFERLRAGPVTATVRHPRGRRQADVRLTREHVAEAIRYMTYSSWMARFVPLYLHEAAAGNFVPIADYLLRWRAGGEFDGLYISITCTEDVPFVDEGAEARDEPTYLGAYRVRQQRAACAEWPRGSVPPTHRQPVFARVPVLIVAGDLDPVTPPGHGDVLARTLENSLQVRVPFGGHAAGGLTGIECLTGLKRDFVERGSLEGLDTGCVGRIRRPPFATRLE